VELEANETFKLIDTHKAWYDTLLRYDYSNLHYASLR
jgi:hypothetical protein